MSERKKGIDNERLTAKAWGMVQQREVSAGPDQLSATSDLSPTRLIVRAGARSARPKTSTKDHDDETSELVRQHFFDFIHTLLKVQGGVSGASLGVVWTASLDDKNETWFLSFLTNSQPGSVPNSPTGIPKHLNSPSSRGLSPSAGLSATVPRAMGSSNAPDFWRRQHVIRSLSPIGIGRRVEGSGRVGCLLIDSTT
jgi:hypothetical protein